MKRFARPYADVLLEAATAAGTAEAVAAELDRFAAEVSGHDDVRKLVENPAVPIEDKEKVVSQLAERTGASDLVRRFLLVLLRNYRLTETADVASAFRTLLDRRENLVLAEVTAAAALTPEQSAKLEAELTKVAGRKVRMTVTIDPTLVAGVVAKIGSTVLDGSLRGEIDRVKRTLGAADDHK
jgi:F-type H+-transporting ATPase subunit delta